MIPRGPDALREPNESAAAVAEPRQELAELVRRLSVVHGRVTLSSGKEADYYVDLRRATLHHRASALIGTLMRELTDDWDYAVVGGLTLGADPVATAVMHAPGRPDRRVRGAQVSENPWPATSYRGIRGLRSAGAGGRGHQHHRQLGADGGARRRRTRAAR